MYLGLINDKTKLTYQKIDGTSINIIGNPLAGETLCFDWNVFLNEPADMVFTFSEKVFVDSIALRLGEKSDVERIELIDAHSGKVLKEYRGETDHPIAEKELLFVVGNYPEKLILRFYAYFANINIDAVNIYGGQLEEKPLYPTPYSVENGEGELLCETLKKVEVCAEVAASAAEVLLEKWNETTGLSLELASCGHILLKEDASIPANGYSLVVKDTVQIYASDLRGFVQGVETLIKLIKDNKLPVISIKDQPFMPFRGVHLYIPAEDQVPFFCRLVKYVLSPMGYNYIIMELAGAMQYDSHPEINQAFEDGVEKGDKGIWPPFPHRGVGEGKTVSKESVRELLAYTRRFGIEIIPEVQSLAHVQFMTIAHPEIAERPEKVKTDKTDERFDDVPPSEFYAHCYCPSNEKSYEILFDLMDEIIELFQPKEYVHMGHDEVYMFRLTKEKSIGLCPICKTKNPAELYAGDVNKIHAYLKEKGLKMMIWSDMVNPITRPKYSTCDAIDMIPKDIVMMDFIWYFHIPDDIEDGLLEKDFRLIYGNMYSSHFPRYEKRIRKDGVFGGEVSAWVPTNEYRLAREGKIYDFLYTAEMLWSDTYKEALRRSYNHVISNMIPALREQLGNVEYPSLHCPSQTVYQGESVEMPQVTVDAFADSVIFSHTCLKPHFHVAWEELDTVGNYVVAYEDGTEEKVELTFDGTIGFCKRRYNEPLKSKYYRHNGYYGTYFTDDVLGKLPDGTVETLYRYEWVNTNPDKKIAYIRRDGENIFTASVEIYKK